MFSLKIVRQVKLFRVILMAFAAFVFNTTEFLPVALLSDIAAGLDVPVEQVGLMMTIYAWIVALMSLPFMLLTAKLERRSLLIKLFLIFVACHVLSAFAWNYWILLVSRIGVAFVHAIFWSITAALVVRLAPKDKKTQALGLLSIGVSLAAVLGLPLGRLIGQYLGWRDAFAIIAVLASVILALFYKILPHLPSRNAGSLSSLPVLMKRPMLMGLYLLVIMIITAHFTAYSYIEPFLNLEGGLGAEIATMILLVFGLAGIVASLLFNRFHRRSPSKFLFIAMSLLAVSLFLLQFFSRSAFLIIPLAFIWGIGISGISLSLQIRVLQLAPDATDVAMSLYSGIFNIGIGGGALLGGIVMKYMGLGYIGYVGFILALVGLLWVSFIQKRYGKTVVATKF